MRQAKKNSAFLRTLRCGLRTVTVAAAAIFAVVPGASAASGELSEHKAQLAPRWTPSKSLADSLEGAEDRRTLVLKLADSTGAAVRDGRLTAPLQAAAKALEVSEVQAALDAVPEAKLRPLFTVPKTLLDMLRQAGEKRTGERLADLSQYFLVQLDADTEPMAEGLLANLLDLPQVENAYVYRQPKGPVDIPPTTPNLLTTPPGQGYRGPAPLGIDIDFAWTQGFRGQGVTIVDIEQNWNLDHEDLDHLLPQVPPVPLIPQSDWLDPALPALTNFDHGTATLGVLSAGDNAYGPTGLVPDAQIHVVPILRLSDPNFIAPNAVLLATLALQPGDVMLLELETPIGADNYPFELFDVEFAVVRQATALGIHVIEPAGNSPGGVDLDASPVSLDPATGENRFNINFRDSGAVMVGAGESALQPGGFRIPYVNSNFGTRVGTHAWGQNVTTLGYGPRSISLANCANPFDPFPLGPPDLNQQYTFCYNGTSAAAAIVAGAAAVLEEAHRARFGQPFGTRELRNHLGVGTNLFGAVGHQPDLQFQLEFFEEGIITHLVEAEARVDTTASVANFGSSVSGIGDVDGDSVPDFLVGVPGYTVDLGGGSLAQFSGRVYVYSGATGTVVYTVDGASLQERLGTSVAGLGDVNSDGVADFVAGTGDPSTPGSAILFSGVDGSILRTLTGVTVGDRFGASVADAGDVDGDGASDVLVGAPGNPASCFASARAELYSGATGALLNTFTSGTICDDFATSVAGGGDVNGDGKLDVLIGAPGANRPSDGQQTGAVFAFSFDGTTPVLSLFPPDPFITLMNFGASVASAGDLDADGRSDLVVGAPTFTQIGIFDLNRGQVYVYSGTGALLDSFLGADRLDGLGTSVAGVGDFDGDGQLDIAAGQPQALGSFVNPAGAGRAVVFVGPFPQPAGMTKTRHDFRTLDTATLLGSAVAAVGDLNGDGKADLLAGEPFGEAEGRAFVFSATPGPDPFAGLGRLVADLPVLEAADPDGDGLGGGGTSPSETTFEIDAGPAFAGGTYVLISVPDLGPALQNAVGLLDANGRTSSPQIGPFPSTTLCSAVGATVDFLAGAARDLNGDGTFDITILTNSVQVEVVNEFPTCP